MESSIRILEVLIFRRIIQVVATETTISTARRSIVIYLSFFLKFWINKIDTSIWII